MDPTPDYPYRDAFGLVVMCMHYHRTRRPAPEERWEIVPAFTKKRPSKVSDGICPECLEKHYPPRSD